MDGEIVADRIDGVRLAEAIDDDVGARLGKRLGDAQANAAGRAGDDRDAAGERGNVEPGQKVEISASMMADDI